MNAKTLEKIINFRQEHGIETMKEIMNMKIFYQFSIIQNKKRIGFYKEKLISAKNKEEIFIIEALAAKEYWGYFESYFIGKADWYGRKPHNEDIVNKMLDIGYHFLLEVILKIFGEIELPCELGLLHSAQSRNAKPLVYDYMEWLRPIVVDRVLLTVLRKKKNKFEKINKKDISVFINKLKEQLNKTYYNKNLGYCIKLESWIKLNALNLLYGINHNSIPIWNFPSLRHESRCKNKKPR